MHETTEMIYLYIRSYMLTSDGRPPAIRKIGEGVRPEKPLGNATVTYHLGLLEKSGYIARVPIHDNGRRVIKLPGAHFVAPPMPEIVRGP